MGARGCGRPCATCTPPPRNFCALTTVVWAMLKNPAYIGQAAFGKTRVGPYTPQKLRAQRGRPAQPRHAVTTDVPAAEWLSMPVPPLVDAALFAAVQEQLTEDRRHARQQLVRLGLGDMHAGLVMTYLTFAVPFGTRLMIGYFKAIPTDLHLNPGLGRTAGRPRLYHRTGETHRPSGALAPRGQRCHPVE